MPRRPKVRSKYAIGEWYGVDFEKMPADEKRQQAATELKAKGLTGRKCPFLINSACNKRGGVCSLRSFQQIESGAIQGVGPLVTICPNRFLEDSTIYSWVGRELLKTDDPIVLSEIGFLNRFKTNETLEEKSDWRQFIGRIDNVLVHPEKEPLEWCALEIQAVYFSGNAMAKEFEMLANFEGEDLPFPAAQRRPDWRSSGPKRLLPQLQTKTPTIRTWGKKIAVVVDEAFFASLIGLEPEEHLSNAEIVWFVVTYQFSGGRWRLVPKEMVGTKLDSSVKALTGGTPLSKEEFERQLVMKRIVQAPDRPLPQL